MKEEEIRPKKLMDKQKEMYMKDITNLLKRKKEFVNVNCPACESNNYEKSLEKYNLTYVVCKECSTMFVNPRPTLKILDKIYTNSKNYEYWNKVIFPASESTRRMKIFKPRAEKTAEIC